MSKDVINDVQIFIKKKKKQETKHLCIYRSYFVKVEGNHSTEFKEYHESVNMMSTEISFDAT